MKSRGSAPAADAHIQPSPAGVSTPVGGNVFPSNRSDYARIASALDYVATHRREQPELANIAFEVGLSPYHFQRLFTRWAGISPKKFLQYVTLAEAKRSLAASASVLDAAYDAGLSGPGRLHDLFLACDSVTPGEFKARGAGLTLRYGFHPSAFGECLLLVSERGIVGLSFVAEDQREAALRRHMAAWPAAGVIADSCATAPYMERISRAPEKTPSGEGPPLRLLLRGTPFQIKVWEALLRVPPGRLVAYGRIAEAIGRGPGAARAVGRACASNPIAYLIPCHRVIHKSGVIGDYRWGQTRKMALIGWEAARANNQDGAA